MKPAPFHGLRKRKDGAWSQGKCLGNPRIEGGRWAWGKGFSPYSNHTALAGDTFIILNLVIEKMLEAPKLHLGKKKPKISQVEGNFKSVLPKPFGARAGSGAYWILSRRGTSN